MFLQVAGAGGATVAFSSAPGAASASPRRRCYVLVLDGCRPDEVDSGLMPTVRELRDGGTHHPRASALPVMETIPNHVMMMTGVRPDRNGVPANAIYDRALGAVRDLDRASDLRATTVLEQVDASGRTSGTVLSKEYLYGIFGTRATHRWEPRPVVPVSGHAPDLFTTDAAIAMVERFDPHLVFVNLGDIDRLGHSDVTGTTVEATRRAALASTDLQVRRFVDLLKTSGRWASSLLVVLADHSMDWSLPHQVISLQPLLDTDPLLAGRVAIAQNGGADLLYWTGPDDRRAEAVRRMREIAGAHPGVLSTHDRVAARPWLRLGARAGDVVVWCRAGWRFSDPDPLANPIPGNHGHPATYPIPFFLAGGHPVVGRGVTDGAHARTVDVAPTVAEFFGLPAPAGGWDGTSRL
jgi:predicted AlkP superfamily pyrophosphatase or phosphodiesterase